MLLNLGINFVRYFMSEPGHKWSLWTGSKQLNTLRAKADAFLLWLGEAHDKYLSAEDPTITLKVCVCMVLVGSATASQQQQATAICLQAVA